MTGDKALLFEPQAADTRKFLEVVLQHMARQQLPGAQGPVSFLPTEQPAATASHNEYMSRCGPSRVRSREIRAWEGDFREEGRREGDE